MLGHVRTQLDERQLKAITLLIDKSYDRKLTDTKIAEAVGVSRQTLHSWRKLPAFNDEWLRQSEESNRSLLAVARTEAERIISNPRTKEGTRVKLIELIYKENGKLKDVSESKVTVDQSEEVNKLLESYGIK